MITCCLSPDLNYWTLLLLFCLGCRELAAIICSLILKPFPFYSAFLLKSPSSSSSKEEATCLLIVPLGRLIVEVETHEVEREVFALYPHEPNWSGSRWWKLHIWIPLWTCITVLCNLLTTFLPMWKLLLLYRYFPSASKQHECIDYDIFGIIHSCVFSLPA